MFATGNARLGALAGFALAAMAVGGLHACATAPTGSPAPESVAVMSDVSVEHDGSKTVVALQGVADPIFTAFRSTDPDRVVVDVSAVRPDRVTEPVAVYDGLVEEVTVAEFAAASGEVTTRVEISLARAADFDVLPTRDRLEIHVRPVAPEGAAAADTPSTTDPTATAADPPAPEVSAGPATQVLAIESEDSGSGSLVRVRTDGALAGVQSFALTDPARLVIDLPELTSSVETVELAGNGGQVGGIRIGQHPDKIRIVIDAADPVAGFAGRQLVPVADGLVIGLGADPSVAWQIAAAEPVAAVAEEAAAETTTLAAVAESTAGEKAPAAAKAETFAMAPEGAAAEVAASEAAAMAPETAAAEVGASEAAAMAPETAAAEVVASEAAAVAPKTAAAEAEAPEADAMVQVAEAESAATPATPARSEVMPAAEASPKGKLAQVYGVQYEPETSRDRVVVVTDRPIDYQILKPDSETLVVSVTGATIDPKAAVRIAPEPGAPISLVTAFSQPDVAQPEVRVVVKRAPGLTPTVTREGTMLIMDFARAGGVASTPPVLAKPASPGAAAVPAVAPAALAPAAKAVPAMAPAALAPAAKAVPAALQPDDPTQILEEGGLLDGKQYVGRRISLDFKDVDIQDVLRLIADVSDLNVIAGDEVKGHVTIRLVEVPWDQALDVILLTKGLSFVRVGNVLRIAPSELLKQEEEARLQERRAKEKLEDLVVKLQPVNYANVQEVKNMVKRLLTPRGSVDLDQRTNTVIMKDIPSVIDEATALIKAIDTQTPQVMIEAKVVEANLDFSREIGSEWGFGSQPDEDQTDFTIGGSQFITAGDTPFPFDQANNVVVSNPISSLANGVLNLGAFILDDRFDVTLRLAAAEANGEGKVISSPRVVTLDNREALIEQGVSIPFQTFENGDAQLEFIDAVLSLKVTPHITADRSIIMKIAVTRNAPDDSVATPTGSPAIAKNQAKTETLVRDGQTLVIGGIYVVDKSETQSRVPYLHQVPVIGMLFKSQTLRDIRKELLIFVTPRVVVGPELAS